MVGDPAGGSVDAAAGADDDLDQYGRGEYDPDTGLYEYYEIPPEQWQRREQRADGVTWARLLDEWRHIECDLQDRGIDVDDDQLMTTRSWRWLRTRITGLLADPTSRTARATAPPPKPRR